MKNILSEIDRNLLISELTEVQFVKYTNKGGNEIYIFQYHEAPNLMLEVARLREIAFRQAGGGTGNYLDIDKYDLQAVPYKQLIVWNPKDKQIVGGYRFAYVPEVTLKGRYFSNLVLSDYYKFSSTFIKEYLPYSIELGRAFIQPRYQATRMSNKYLFALDNLFDGIGALSQVYPNLKYFFGKVTLYKQFPENARNLLLKFLYNHFGTTELVEPINHIKLDFPLDRIYSENATLIEFKFRALLKSFRDIGVQMPPMVSAYLRLSPSMKVLGTVHDPDFGDVDETAIVITIKDMYPNKIERHLKIQKQGAVLKTAC